MTIQISQRGKEYLETARTLLRAAQTMTDRAIAVSLRPWPTTISGELRGLRMRTQPKHWLDRTLAPNANGKHEPEG
jgi:hypothetical protein